ncbi:MAG: alcohol dehydrogenase catalytic domain-containing protein [Dehalococcoidales bacterium]|nr:alcohol dehydrogenase catalytic domain-containing protein [Dehalococcoidales bacterium]
MFAVGMIRGKPEVHDFKIPRPQITQPDEVLVRVKEVGLDGTDFGIVSQGTPDIAEGRNEMVMGHEMVGVVEEVGNEVKSLAPGDPVAVTVRRGCGICAPCLHNQSDMCMTGLFKERGIHQLDGYLTHYVVDREQYMVKIPSELTRRAVFTEALSIAEKGIEQIRVIQSRMPWACPHPEHSFQSRDWGGCKTALVVGAGPLGLLATVLIRLAKTNTFVADIVPEESPKARLVKNLGAQYIDASTRMPQEIVDICCKPSGNLNVIFEASGAAETAVHLIPFMSRSSICVMTGIPKGDLNIRLDAAELVRRIVRYNQVVVGSVNSNRMHFEMALKDLGQVDSRFGGVLREMITHRFRLNDYQRAFSLNDPEHIKTVVEVEPWD